MVSEPQNLRTFLPLYFIVSFLLLTHYFIHSSLLLLLMAAQQIADCAFAATNIKSHIPLILDLDDHNYDAWREFCLTHFQTFDVLRHVDGSSTPKVTMINNG